MEVQPMAAEVRLRVGQYRKFCTMRDWKTENQQAIGLGIAASTVNRILKGDQKPGSAFIAAVLAAFPALDFNDLFEVIDDPHPAENSTRGAA